MWVTRCLLALVLLLLSPLSSSVVSAGDADALLALKDNWSDPFNTLESWSPGTKNALCSWKGITCQAAGNYVAKINLRGLLRGGSLASAIGALTNLTHLQLPRNELNGTIPPQISLLKNLVTLDLSGNFFAGQIPSNLSNLKSLQSLNLAYNRLEGPIPEQLGNLLLLQSLNLRHNLLFGRIPTGLANASELRSLWLENNSLSGEIPRELGRLPHLRLVAVENNTLSGDIPPDFANLKGLVALYFGQNQLNGTIPDWIGNLSKLNRLQLQRNDLVGQIPKSLGSLKALTDLRLSFNHINGSIPQELGQLVNLSTLYLQRNNLSGSIPPKLGELSSLKQLDLSYNNLTGRVPQNGILSNFSSSSFIGNPGLCGKPLNNSNCEPPVPPLAVPPSQRDVFPPPPPPGKSKSNMSGIIIGAVLGSVGFCVVLILLFVFFNRQTKQKKVVQVQNWFSPEMQGTRGRGVMEMFIRNFRYSYEEIVSCAGYYDTAHVLGKGRFATVYRSTLPDGTQLAVKVLKFSNVPASFEKDVDTLGTIKHRHLLPIRGYYSNPVEKAIFFDFMPGGTLFDLLHSPDKNAHPLPDWATRQKIALCAAQALAFLHRGSAFRIIHKDVKSSNILLDADMSPYLSDYGLAGLVYNRAPEISPAIMETPGYTAPEVISTKKSTEKSDVYSFGVVLLELITGKKPVANLGDRSVSLVNWSKRLHKEGRGKELLDQTALETSPFFDYLNRALNLAILCVNDNPSQRPTMSEVASILESLYSSPSPLRSPEQQRGERPLLIE